MATAPRAFALDPFQTLVSVGWNVGWFVVITVEAIYSTGASGSRSASITLTDLGRKAGGQILGQKKFEYTEDGARGMQHQALLVFARDPKDDRGTFKIALAGAINVTAGSEPPPTTAPFCGRSSATHSWGPFYATPIPCSFPPCPWNFWQDVVSSYTTPAGTTGMAMTNGPIAGLRYPDDVGKGASTLSATSLNIWYQDAAGNYINTYEPCDVEGPLPTPSPVTRLEGFKLIRADVYPRIGYKAKPVGEWARNALPIVAVNDKAFGRAQFRSLVPRRIVGADADHKPKYEDLPNGNYEFTTGFLRLDRLPMLTPPQPYQTYAAWPFVPPLAQYSIHASTKAATYHPPTEPISGTGERQEKLFPAGTRPPVNQDMEQIPEMLT